ncbi:hypothetical protein L1987_21212 [Smallanthus sonchifolius]|uniref:Uncharacterized protein n=1 Tax=Smallanthus sonchifolius TaxID=185202 RepID=A0ACB9IVF6_9ASTR|nr:hypothetical protein L1987_21212 [Smallanthus sonchifolius]
MSSLNASDIHRIFKKLDRNNADSVSVDDLQLLLESMKLCSSVDELECFAGKKNINFAELEHMCNSIFPQEAGDGENDLLKSFELFDNNLDCFISCDELRNALSVLGLVDEHNGIDVDKMIKAFDVNSDGLLDFDEFKKMMR